MKIGILTDVLNEHSGARASIKLAEALAKKDQVEVVFFTTGQILSGETYRRLKGKHKVRIFKKPKFVSLELVGLLKEEGLDLVSAHCSLRILISAYLSGIKIFRTDYGTQFPSLNGNYGTWRISFVKRVIFLIADVYVFIRDYLKFLFSYQNVAISADHARKIKRLFAKKVDFIYLGGDDFDFQKFPPGENPDLKIRILSVSRFVPYKGFHILIEAFKSLTKNYSNLELILVGGQADKTYLDFLKKFVADDPRIRFVFDPADEILGRLFSSSQIYASGTRWEAFGLPFLEASFFGLPTLAFSYFGPASEVVKDEKTGLLAASLKDFKSQLERLISDESLRLQLGRGGREFARTFTWEKTACGYIEIFKRTVL